MTQHWNVWSQGQQKGLVILHLVLSGSQDLVSDAEVVTLTRTSDFNAITFSILVNGKLLLTSDTVTYCKKKELYKNKRTRKRKLEGKLESQILGKCLDAV